MVMNWKALYDHTLFIGVTFWVLTLHSDIQKCEVPGSALATVLSHWPNIYNNVRDLSGHEFYLPVLL